MNDPAGPGFFGKLPARGDFISRRLPREFLDAWDAWLQETLVESRAALGDKWLPTYLASPLWHFVLGGGVCGSDAWGGVLMPSVDSVGRYFPFTIVAQIPVPADPVLAASERREWFEAADSLALSALDEDIALDLEAFSTSVAALGDWTSTSPPRVTAALVGTAWRLPLAAPQAPREALLSLLGDYLGTKLGAYSVWWSAGSELVQPSVLVCAGLPASRSFTAMLDGKWLANGWHVHASESPV